MVHNATKCALIPVQTKDETDDNKRKEMEDPVRVKTDPFNPNLKIVEVTSTKNPVWD